jgi:peptidoglycan/LPS O-acetylase OafA/YrhL
MSQADRVALLRQGARLPELDGIRGVAILLILFLHWFVIPIEPLLREWSPRFCALADFAWCGVDLFFVLSGFLIAGILLDHRDSPNLFRTFYARRACRILPAYLVLLLLVTIPIGGPPRISQGQVPLAAYLLFLQNFWSAAGAQVAFVLGPCWSLAIEEQFYLALPLLLLRVFRGRFASFATVMLVAPPLLRCLCLANGTWSAWDFTPCRIDAPFWGVVAAVVVRDPAAAAFLDRRRRELGWVAGLGLMGIIGLSQLVLLPAGKNLLISIGLSVVGSAFAVALLAIVLSPDSLVARLMRLKPLGWVGKRSYFLYLFHLLVFFSLPIASFPAHLAASACILGVLAAISWRWVEQPFLRLGATVRYGAPGLASPAAGGAG